MTTPSPTHFVIGRIATKRPAQRCRETRCAVLTRHRSQRCPEHRGRRRAREIEFDEPVDSADSRTDRPAR